MLDPAEFIQNIFYAAGGLALMLGVPAMASKVKGGLPLLFMGLGALGLYLYGEGYISL